MVMADLYFILAMVIFVQLLKGKIYSMKSMAYIAVGLMVSIIVVMAIGPNRDREDYHPLEYYIELFDRQKEEGGEL